MAEQKSKRLDSITKEGFTSFEKEAFEVNWEKVCEGKLSQVYKVKLKLWPEKCAIKTFSTSTDYRYDSTVSEMILITFHFHSDLFV